MVRAMRERKPSEKSKDAAESAELAKSPSRRTSRSRKELTDQPFRSSEPVPPTSVGPLNDKESDKALTVPLPAAPDGAADWPIEIASLDSRARNEWSKQVASGSVSVADAAAWRAKWLAEHLNMRKTARVSRAESKRTQSKRPADATAVVPSTAAATTSGSTRLEGSTEQGSAEVVTEVGPAGPAHEMDPAQDDDTLGLVPLAPVELPVEKPAKKKKRPPLSKVESKRRLVRILACIDGGVTDDISIGEALGIPRKDVTNVLRYEHGLLAFEQSALEELENEEAANALAEAQRTAARAAREQQDVANKGAAKKAKATQEAAAAAAFRAAPVAFTAAVESAGVWPRSCLANLRLAPRSSLSN